MIITQEELMIIYVWIVCLLFMGFTDKDYENIIKDNPTHHGTVLFPRDKIIRMAGNSIPVKLLEGIFYQVIKLDKELNK